MKVFLPDSNSVECISDWNKIDSDFYVLQWGGKLPGVFFNLQAYISDGDLTVLTVLFLPHTQSKMSKVSIEVKNSWIWGMEFELLEPLIY